MKQKILDFYYKMLGKLASNYINRHKPLVIGVTGSIGKTSARMIISEILSDYLKDKVVYTSVKNFNGELGMSFSIFKIEKYSPSILALFGILIKCFFISYFGKKEYDVIFLEYGIDHVGEMDFLLSIVRPDISFVTKIDKVHSLQFGSPDVTAREKYKLVQATKDTVFINMDDSYGRSLYDQIDIDKFYYTTDTSDFDKLIDINYEDYQYSNMGHLKANFDFTFRGEKYFGISTNLLGKENIGYIGIGFIILDILGYKFNNTSFLESHKGSNVSIDFHLQPGRFSFFTGLNESVLIDSSYNASPLSMRKIIENVISIRNNLYHGYKLILCLGDMRELGDFAEKEHRFIAGIVSQSADYVFVVGENMQKFMTDELVKIGFNPDSIFIYDNSIELGEGLKDFVINSNEKYIILFKGSQNTIFLEEAVKSLLLNQEESEKLPRQEDWWIAKKFS